LAVIVRIPTPLQGRSNRLSAVAAETLAVLEQDTPTAFPGGMVGLNAYRRQGEEGLRWAYQEIGAAYHIPAIAQATTLEAQERELRKALLKKVIADAAKGAVDVLIGTHRLLSRDVRPKDLGLLIVDEEQRFGVRQKELLRQLRLKVDVLAMSATPIPRTLQMSLAGLRDISVIETPPEGRRPVRTHVGPYDEDLIGRAIRREKERGGQIFFLHNRIDSLHENAEGLRALCPDVRFAEAHGQMDELELEATMLGFVRGEHDCLVTTTIIESGLDIPNANTLIAERAHAVTGSFTLTETTAPLVTDICRRLDGVPLAIELAAARVNHLPLPALRERMDRRLPLLTGGPRDRPPRLQTMRAAIAWRRCVFPTPTPPYRKSGLYDEDPSATASAPAWASRLPVPTTNCSNVNAA